MFLHAIIPPTIALTIGPLTIYWYGIVMAVAIIVGLLLALLVAKKRGLNPEIIFDVAIWLVIGGLIGARVYEIFLEWSFYGSHPQEIIQIWHGGLAIHGALIGGALALWFYCKRKKVSLWPLLSVLVPALALAQAIGRWGNWFNQELFGRPTNSNWGIPISPFNRPAGFETDQYFLPTFLFESLGLLILAAILYFLVIKNKLNPKKIFSIYLIGYGLIRFLLEFIKIDQTPIVLGLRWPQIISLIMIVAGIIIFTNKKTEV